MRYATTFLPLLICFTVQSDCLAQHGAKADILDRRPAVLMEGLGHLHHAISTRSPEAQRFFDQGLTLAYGFNHEGAYRCFRQAALLDPKCAMAYWGMAESLSPNINDDVNMDWEMAASRALDKALALPNVPEDELAYIQSQLLRHSRNPAADFKLCAANYSKAMRELWQRFPDDPDAATLYVESLFDLHPWSLWTADRKPTGKDTEDAIETLESVLRSHPDHIGANHYYIHALEPSPWPERAWASAKRLEYLAPNEGHLRHMPSHIYMHTGDYEAAARSNVAAIAADRANIKAYGSAGDYPMYLGHNIDFLRYAYTMSGEYAAAKRASIELVENIGAEMARLPQGQAMPSRERYLAATILVQARFYRWDDILRSSAPEPKLLRTTAMWHYARALAHAARGEADRAAIERDRFAAAAAKIPADSGYGLCDWGAIVQIGSRLLEGKIAQAKGDFTTAVNKLEEAVSLQDALAYDETPDWYYPIRESLGAALIRSGRPLDAEAVFRADLERNPRNGRSLFGLLTSLREQKKATGAKLVLELYRTAWRRSDVTLRIADL